MAAGVHYAAILRSVGKMIGFCDGQSIYIGTQSNAFFAVTVFQNTDNSSAANTGVNLDTPFGEVVCNGFCRFIFLIAQFRMSVEMAANFRKFGGQFIDTINRRHILSY